MKNSIPNSEMSSIVRLYCHEWELSVIPLQPNSKKPAISWQEFQRRIPTQEEIDQWQWHGLGIVTGTVSSLVVLDADNQETVDMLETAQLCRGTARVRTRRGVHYYFSVYDLPTDFGCQKIYHDRYKVDIKANGGYVVAPPTSLGTNGDRTTYEWLAEDTGYVRPFLTLSFQELQGLLTEIKLKAGGEKKPAPAPKKQVFGDGNVDLERLKEVILSGYTVGHRQDICMYLAGMLRKAGVDVDAAIDFVTDVCIAAQDEEKKTRIAAVRKTFESKKESVKGLSGLVELGYEKNEILSCFRKPAEIQQGSKKSVTIEDIAYVLMSSGFVANYDEFFVKFFVEEQELSEELETRLHVMIENTFQKRISRELVQQGIAFAAYQNKRDRLKEYLYRCKDNWDGVNRLESFFYHTFGVPEDEYTRTVAKNFFISAVARALSPGSFVKNILVLQGHQNSNKSRVLAALGGKWHREINVSIATEKDFYMAIQGVWIAELPEMDSLRKADRNRIKAIISSPVDRYRPPYGRNMQDFARRCVFTCTTNDLEIFEDPSGGTRFWPVEVRQKGKIEWVLENRGQLFGEAVIRYERGETYWEVPEEQARERQEAVQRSDEWVQVIDTGLRHIGKTKTTIYEVATEILGIQIGKLTKGDQMRISDALRQLGWIKKTVRVGDKTPKMWFLPEEDT
jgi:putative DNA primase/helicase